MSLLTIYFLIALTKLSVAFVILMVFFSVLLFICSFLIGANTEEEKRIISIGSTILILISVANCFVPSKNELIVMLGASYYTNGSVNNTKDPLAQKAIQEFLKSYDFQNPATDKK